MTKPSIMLAPLTTLERGGWLNPHFGPALVQWATDPRWSLVYQMSHGFWTSQESRNHACRAFLDSPCDYLLMVDNDTKPHADGRIVDLPEMALYGLPIVGAPVPVLHEGVAFYHNVYERDEGEGDGSGYPRFHSYPQEAYARALLHGPLLKCDAVGTGAICIRRDVVEAFNHLATVSQADLAMFTRPRKPDGSTRIGEDLWFCHRAGRPPFGFPIHASLPHACGHLHTVDYGDIPRMTIVTGAPPPKPTGDTPAPSPPSWYTREDYRRALGVDLPFPDSLLTPYALTPHQCQFLLYALQEYKPSRAMEFGMGISTFLFHEWALGLKDLPPLWTGEGSTEYRESVSRSLGESELNPDRITFSGLPEREHLAIFDGYGRPVMVLVDGNCTAGHGVESVDRHSMVEVMSVQANPGDILILDDCHRPYERSIITQLQAHLGSVANPWFVPFPDGKVMGVWRVDALPPAPFRYRPMTTALTTTPEGEP